MTKADFDVAIVGCGPVGAVAACLLGQAGIRTVVIDRTDAIYEKSRAVALDHEIARVLQSLGLADAIAPYAEPFTDSKYHGAGGRLIKHLTMVPEPYPQAWTPSMVFMQPAMERLLRDRLASLPTVALRLNQTVTGFQQDADHVRLEVETASGTGRLTAGYVIGCDGASSTIRKLAGMELEDLGFDQPWLVVDVLAHAQGLAKLPRTSVQYCEPERPTTFVICTGNHRRWEMRLNDDEDRQLMETPAETWKLLARWITPEDGVLWRSASYRFHALVARQWRSGRVFIAGDAAHQQPPFLGQGLCQGVRDVANLTWKLARVIKGQSSEGLLDTYGLERASHVRRLTGIIKGIGALIGERDPEQALARDERLIAEAGGTIKPMPRQDLMPGLDCGLLSSAAGSARGSLFPQPWIQTPSGPQRLDDPVGTGLRIITVSERVDELTAMQAMADALGATFIVIRSPDKATSGRQELVERNSVVRDWLQSHGATVALVRPDNYVFGASADVSGLSSMATEFRRALA
jgi:3-(3-hydroxy-phenyl)propionate hydroxylase